MKFVSDLVYCRSFLIALLKKLEKLEVIHATADCSESVALSFLDDTPTVPRQLSLHRVKLEAKLAIRDFWPWRNPNNLFIFTIESFLTSMSMLTKTR